MRIFASLLLALFLIAGCSSDPNDDCTGTGRAGDPYIGEQVFDRCAGFSITTDRTSYAIGDTLSLTVAFTPLYSGVGEIAVWFLPLEQRSGQQGVVVTEPEITSTDGAVWKFEVDLSGDGRLLVPIRFVVNDNTPYHVTATVRFKKVYDPLTEQLYVIGSEEQKEALGPLDHTQYGSSVPLELPRPVD